MSFNYLPSVLFRNLVLSSFFLLATLAHAKTNTQIWQASNEDNVEKIDHSAWQYLLDQYLLTNHPSRIHLYDYQAVTQSDKHKLKRYLKALSQLDPLAYSRTEQMAYWINLYNALTIDLILDHYPVKSITKLGEKFFSFGPWDDPIITINNQSLTLNDIEHQILRPIWQDPRIHYAVNCASWSCPNLAASAYTSDNLHQLLNQGAHDYVNHRRGVRWDNNSLVLSKIYDWYQEDFGNNESALLSHLMQYADPELKARLSSSSLDAIDIDYEYNWQLNAP